VQPLTILGALTKGEKLNFIDQWCIWLEENGGEGEIYY